MRAFDISPLLRSSIGYENLNRLVEFAARGDQTDGAAPPPGAPTDAAARPGAAPPPPGGLTVADDHLADLLLAADPRLAADLAASRLAPLAELPEGPHARLRETLAAWLDRPGQVQAVAAALDVHPQTVRYRVRQLRDLFGDRLDDPDARFELSLALRVR